MVEDSIEILTKQMIEEHFNKSELQKYVITKNDLYRFCIKLLKVINKFEER